MNNVFNHHILSVFIFQSSHNVHVQCTGLYSALIILDVRMYMNSVLYRSVQCTYYIGCPNVHVQCTGLYSALIILDVRMYMYSVQVCTVNLCWMSECTCTVYRSAQWTCIGCLNVHVQCTLYLNWMSSWMYMCSVQVCTLNLYWIFKYLYI